jgi:hypothetical protein
MTERGARRSRWRSRLKEEGGLFDATRCLSLTQAKQKAESRKQKSEI